MQKINPSAMARTIQSLQDMLARGLENDGEVVCRLLEETKNALGEYARQNNSRFIMEKLALLPSIAPPDFQVQDEFSLGFIEQLAGIRSTRQKEELLEKIQLIRSELNPILAVIQNPGLEKMYYNA